MITKCCYSNSNLSVISLSLHSVLSGFLVKSIHFLAISFVIKRCLLYLHMHEYSQIIKLQNFQNFHASCHCIHLKHSIFYNSSCTFRQKKYRFNKPTSLMIAKKHSDFSDPFKMTLMNQLNLTNNKSIN